MNEETRASSLEQNIKSRSTWLRFLYMLLFAAILSVAAIVLSAVVIIQFLIFLLTRKPNLNLRDFGRGLGAYAYQIIEFLTFNSDEHPFPFAPWPEGPPRRQEEEPSGPDEADEHSGV